MPIVKIPTIDVSVPRSRHSKDGSLRRIFIFDETVTLCLYRLGRQVAATVGEVLRDPTVVAMLRITPEDEQHAWLLWLARPDKTYSFTDCTSFVIMRRLGLQSAIAVDTDFQREGFLLLPPP